MASLPLIAQPGERFYYGVNTDLLGVIIEKVTGQSLGAFMQARIFGPLGMVDTGFGVPVASRGRLARVYQREGKGPLDGRGSAEPDGVRSRQRIPYPDPDGRLFHSGGGGLFSTADDYMRFAQMLLDGGALDGVRILGRKTVATMTSDQNARLPKGTPSHQGFGFGVSVRLDQGGGAAGGLDRRVRLVGCRDHAGEHRSAGAHGVDSPDPAHAVRPAGPLCRLHRHGQRGHRMTATLAAVAASGARLVTPLAGQGAPAAMRCVISSRWPARSGC